MSALERALRAALAAIPAAALLAGPTAGNAEAASANAIPGASSISANAALVVGGTSFPTMDTALMANFTSTFSDTLLNVPYPAQLWPFTPGDRLGPSVSTGVANLLDLLRETYSAGMHLTVWGISQGALVADQAMRLLASDAAAPPPGALTFVRVADPSAPVTGLLNFIPNALLSGLLNADNSFRSAPTDSQFNTVIVTNEYDGFADFPDRPNILAVTNALIGLYYRHAQTATADLAAVPLQNISTTINGSGATTTTVLVPSPFLPLTEPLRDAGLPAAAIDRLNAVLRPLIDAGYSRNDASLNATASTSPPPAAVIDTGQPRRIAVTVETRTEDAAGPFRPAASRSAIHRSGPRRSARTGGLPAQGVAR